MSSETYVLSRKVNCARPAPELLEANRGVWEVFRRCQRGRGVIYATAFGCDSVSRGIDPIRAREVALSADVPWHSEAVERFEYLEDCWIGEIDRVLAERQEEERLKREAEQMGQGRG